MNLPILLAAARAPAEARGDAGIQGRKSRPAQAGEHEGLHGPHEGILRPLPDGSTGAEVAHRRRAATQDEGSSGRADQGTGQTRGDDVIQSTGRRRRAMRLAAAARLAGVLHAQLNGVIDIHAHADPDSVPRSIDAIDLARLAKERGMRGMVLKSHYEPTASLAYLVSKVVPGIAVFGGIDLNRSVGGVNPAAIERMVLMKGGLGRVVWMPTFDAENQVRYSKQDRPFVAVSKNGALLPEVKAVIALAAKHGLTLETGHSAAEECLMIVREARRAGVRNVVVTHAMLAPVHMTVAQMQEAAGMGAWLEFVYNALIGPNKEFEFADYARAIRAVGAEHCILSSDLGQVGNPLHPDGLVAFFAGLKSVGLSPAEIDQMSQTNPAKALGLN